MRRAVLIVCFLFSVIPSAVRAGLPAGATSIDQSTFALGSLALNVIFVESDGTIDDNQEDWSVAQISKIQQEISQSVGFWEGLAGGYHPNAQLSIDVNYVNNAVPLTTHYEPIARSTTEEHLWINQVMSTLGYNGTSSFGKFSNVRNYNNDQRSNQDTHWATTMFIVNDLVDADNRFADERFAYAYLGGPFIVLTYGNNGWGADGFHRVAAHELGHVFFALDEHFESGSRNFDLSGYLNYPNLNAERDPSGKPVTPPQPNALMLNNVLIPSQSTSYQVGHRDLDADTIPDILDTIPLLSGDDTGSDSDSGRFVFGGLAEVNPLQNRNDSAFGFSNSREDMTINWIDSAWYNVDEQGWEPFAAVDGSYDLSREVLGFSLDELNFGSHRIDVRVFNSVDNASEILSFEFESTVPEPAVLWLLSVVLCHFKRRRWVRGRPVEIWT